MEQSEKQKVGKNLFYSHSNINMERLASGTTAMVKIELVYTSSGYFKNLSDEEILSAVKKKIAVSVPNDNIFKHIEIKPPSF